MTRAKRAVTAGLVLALALGCDATAPERLTFPPGFRFGTAVAGFQADMGCPTLGAACDDPSSDWYAFVTSPTMIADPATFLSGDPPAAGPGMWELYEADCDRAAHELGTNALRFSLEWSRIFPTATDDADGYEALQALADPSALAHYHAMLQALATRGLEPLVTLNHYTLPAWIHDGVGCHEDLGACSPRGWLDAERTVREIAKYAGFCAREFGAEVDLWATLNEPFAIVLPGYVYPSADRVNPPAVKLMSAEAKVVVRALITAHARMYDAVKAADVVDADGDGLASQVGVVYAMSPARPKDPENPFDVQAAANVFYLYNLVYLNAVAHGDLDADLTGTPVHDESLANRLDYLGVNYYTRVTVEGLEGPFLPQLSPLTTFNPFTLEAWEDYPRGIYEMLMAARDLGVPAIVTENGTPDPADDGTGPSYLVRHLAWVARALRDGADVRGYYYWTLMDNYEWNHGMGIKMGLYAVSPDDPAKLRVPRGGAAAYGAIARAGAIPTDLLARYPAAP